MLKTFNCRSFIAECLGTAVLVLFACGVAVFSGADLVATALTFGLVLIALIYIIGPVSGCHVNPAVSLAMAINKRIGWIQFVWYIVAQFVGAVIGSAILYALQKLSGVDSVTALGQNGFDGNSAIGLNMGGAFIIEAILTFVFVSAIIVSTSREKGAGKKAGIVIGLTLTLVHLVGIRLTGTSVNPARSLAPALLLGGTPLRQVWVFILAPLVGAALAALFTRLVVRSEDNSDDKVVTEE
ncbi:MAG: aquaporin [Christensenellaceae bacterium]|nr:aquaporin [Christensenellaceae bacterium]